jgi:hypothetical protein
MVHQVLLLGAGFVTRPTAVELDKAGVKVTVGKQARPIYLTSSRVLFILAKDILIPNSLPYPRQRQSPRRRSQQRQPHLS